MAETEQERIEAELAIVRAALLTLAQGGQSVSVGDLTYTEVNYSALAARERELEGKLARYTGRRPIMVGVDLSGVLR
jgi:hypothetical protein